ncbi:MAG: hypothetical protein H6Q74_2260 [Firmicutes bacterium]|nr:hypothetical protein [Bacillota bacterium]
MRNRKYMPAPLMVALMTILLLVANITSIVEAAVPDAKATVIKAFHQNIKDCHITINAEGSITLLGQANSFGCSMEGDVQAKPLVGKATMKFTMDLPTGAIADNGEAYFEVINNQETVYTKENNNWQKTSVPIVNLTDYDKYITAAKLIREDNTVAVFEVTFTKEALKTFELIQPQGMPKPLGINWLDGIGDIKTIVTIDKKTSTISELAIDLSKFIATIVETAIAEKLPDDKKQLVKIITDNFKANLDIKITPIKLKEKIIIPKEAKDAPLVSVH